MASGYLALVSRYCRIIGVCAWAISGIGDGFYRMPGPRCTVVATP